ncbi:hypothetical protein N665_0206s0075 [Sinapis alba]|nr:hypothetical protein N665_0206s0075 [Sinapis alba]
MRSSTIFLVSCILMSFVLNNVKVNAEARFTPVGSLCGRKEIFVGRCGLDGNNMCIEDFLKKEGDRPYSCECDNFDKKHLCRCDFPC